MSQNSSPSPSKGNSVKDFSREKLEKLFTDSIKKLKTRDKQLTEVTNERDTLAKQLSEGQDHAADLPDLQKQLEEQLAQNEKLETRLEEAEKTVTSSREELESSRKEFDARLEESQQQISLLEEQTNALKDQIRQSAENRDAEIANAVKPLKERLQEMAQNTTRVESIARTARASAGKSQAESQVLEGALEGTKSLLEASEKEKLSLEAQIQQLMVEAERNEAENKKKVEDLQKQLANSGLSPKSPTETEDKSELAGLRLELLNKMEAWKIREAELLKTIEEGKIHAQAREVEVEEKVTQTQKELDVLLPELQNAQTILSTSSTQASENLFEARQMLAEKTVELQDMEDRVARAESALNVANAHIEEQGITSPQSQSSHTLSPKDSRRSSDLTLEPELPDIKERRSFSSRHLSEEEQADRIQKLESYVEQLEEEITHLRKVKDEMADVKAEKDRVENAVRNYLAEKPAEDALREKELQQAKSETEKTAQELQKTEEERDKLQAQIDDLKQQIAQSHTLSSSSEKNIEGEDLGEAGNLNQELEASRREVESLSQQCETLRSEIQRQTQSKEDRQLTRSEDEKAQSENVDSVLPNGDLLDSEQRNEEFRALKNKLQASQQAQIRLENQVKELQDSKNASVEQTNGVLSQQIASDELLEAQKNIENLERDLTSSQDKLKQLENTLQNSDAVNEKTVTELKSSQSHVTSLQETIKSLTNELESLKLKLGELGEETASEDQNSIIQEKEDVIKNLTTELGSLREEKILIENRLDSSESHTQIDSLRAEKNQLETHLQEVSESYAQSKKEKDELEKSLQTLNESRAQIENLQEDISKLKDSLTEKTELCSARESHLEKLSQELAEAQEKLESLDNASSVEELENARSEIAKLTESQDTLKQTLSKEKERAHRFISELKKRLEKAEKKLKQVENEKENLRQSESEQQTQITQSFETEKNQLKNRIGELESLANESSENAKTLEAELSSYKARAHSLLKSKDAELKSARENAESSIGQALQEAQNTAKQAQEELQKVQEAMSEAENSYEEKLQETEQRLEQNTADLRDALEEAQSSAESSANAIEQWRRKYEALEGRLDALKLERRQPSKPPSHLVQRHAEEISSLNDRYKALQDDFTAFKESSQQIAESRDKELERQLGLNASLRDELSIYRNRRDSQNLQVDEEEGSDWNFSRMHSRQPPLDDRASFYSAGSRTASGSFANNLGILSRNNDFARHFQDEGWNFSDGRVPSDWGFPHDPSQDANLARFSEQQARKDEELHQIRKRASELEAEIADLAREVDLRQEQETALKEALREAERERSRLMIADKQRLDIEYLKNTVLKLYETGQAHVLLPAISTILHFSPAELKKCQEGLAKQAELYNEAPVTESSQGNQGGYLGNWTSWAFGESES